MIRFDAVTRHYGNAQAPALREISVEFHRGDFVFLIGASGSGKSTLLRMVLREALPQGGKVTVAGQNLSLMMPRRVPEYRRSIGMVFQDFRLLPDKTIYENVAFAMRVIGAPRSAIRNRVMTVLSRVNLEHLAKRYPHEISGGEQQRAAIARAIVNSPAILLADEPTGNLDPRASEEVMKILRWINDSGTTVIMATHDRAIVDRMARRVVQLHHGELVRDDAEGVYDPSEGSHAWNVLSQEAEKTGLRAQDPMPLRTELTPIVPAAISAHPSPASPESATTPDHADADVPAQDQSAAQEGHQGAPGQAGSPGQAGAPDETASNQAAVAETRGDDLESADTHQLSAVTRYRVTWPEDETLTDEDQKSPDAVDVASESADGSVMDVHLDHDAAAVPDFESTDQHTATIIQRAETAPPDTAHTDTAHTDTAQTNTPQTNTPQPGPASSSAAPVPRPRASAAEATYSDTRRTAEQLQGSRRRGLFGRKRGRG